jgi:hypothetical protein
MTPSPGDPTPAAAASPPREGRLRPEYAHLYPGIPAGTWMLAATLAKHLLTGMVSDGKLPPRINARLLDDDHFEFRGGGPPTGGRRSSRISDMS